MTGTNSEMMSFGNYSMNSVFSEMTEDTDSINNNYDVLAGRLSEKAEELIIVLPSKDTISDLLVYSLGLRPEDELTEIVTSLIKGEEVKKESEPLIFTYDDLMNIPLKLISPSDIYKYNERYNIYEDMSEDNEYMQTIYDSSKELKIVGILAPKENINSHILFPGVLYTKQLIEEIIQEAKESEIVKKQLENEDINVFSGKEFNEDDELNLDLEEMISVDENLIAEAFSGNISEKDIKNITEKYIKEISNSLKVNTPEVELEFSETLATIATDVLKTHIKERGMSGVSRIKLNEVDALVKKVIKKSENQVILNNLEAKYLIPKEVFEEMYTGIITGMLKTVISIVDEINVLENSVISNETENTEENNRENTVETTNALIIEMAERLGIELDSDINLDNVSDMVLAEESGLILVDSYVELLVNALLDQEDVRNMSKSFASKMVEAKLQKDVLTKVGELTATLMETAKNAFSVDQNKIARAFKFQLEEDELRRIMSSMTNTSSIQNAKTNLMLLGYQDIDEPSAISFYFKTFDDKEKFLEYLDKYNKEIIKEDESKEIKYTDITGILMSSINSIVNNISYALIAFISISLVVSSIMIGIITYISVLERTKEIGILRAIGASKRNISTIFNAETFIIGTFAGIIGIGVSKLLIIPINTIIYKLTKIKEFRAVLPLEAGAILIILSIILTLIGGIIPSKQAANKDPVLALRSE